MNKDLAIKELYEALNTMTVNADEDCPVEHRTRHFNDALNDAHEVLNKYAPKK